MCVYLWSADETENYFHSIHMHTQYNMNHNRMTNGVHTNKTGDKLKKNIRFFSMSKTFLQLVFVVITVFLFDRAHPYFSKAEYLF